MSKDVKKMPGRDRMRVMEKPKNFSFAIKRLFKELDKYKKLIIISCILAMLGSALSIVAPNQLSKLTDEITNGLMVNKDDISILSKMITKKIDEKTLAQKYSDVLDINLDEEVINNILSSDIADEDKDIFRNFLNDKNIDIKKLPNNVLMMIFSDSTYDNVYFSAHDKVSIIKGIDSFDLPKSFQKIIFDDLVYNGVKISYNDQYLFVKKMKGVTKKTKPDQMYKRIDSMPKSIKKIIKPKMNFDTINFLFILIATIYILSACFNYIESVIMSTLSNEFANNLRQRISIKINKLPLKYFDKHMKGDILSRVTNDVDTIAQTMNQSLASLVSSLTLFLGTLFMMFVTNIWMALTAVLSSLIGFVIMSFILKNSQKYFKTRQDELGNLNGQIEETYSGLFVVKAYNGNNEADRKFNEYNKRVCESNKKSQFISGLMMPIMGFIGNFGYVLVCIVGALLVLSNSITFGVIVAFMIYIRLFTNPLSQIAQAMTSLQSAAAASERVFDFIDEEEMSDETNNDLILKCENAEGYISFKNVSFRYDGNEKDTIHNFTAYVKPGQKVAIVGPTGAGKTTMVNLLMKFYNITDGDIKIDGVSIKSLSRENVHNLFTMVLQDTWLFEGTIKENIIFNRTNLDDNVIDSVCKDVGLDHFIKTLPDGYDTIISDSENISAGQRQLLTIARGMTENSPFLILDEATSNVDTRTEQLVQTAMDKLTKGKTSFIIAHRLSTIKNADIILVMNDGNIVEQGNHDELMLKKGYYYNLYNAQFEK